jgi:hypothetical protein
MRLRGSELDRATKPTTPGVIRARQANEQGGGHRRIGEGSVVIVSRDGGIQTPASASPVLQCSDLPIADISDRYLPEITLRCSSFSTSDVQRGLHRRRRQNLLFLPLFPLLMILLPMLVFQVVP